MIHLQSNQRLYISDDLRGYVDKLNDDGTITYSVDFLQLGFAYAVNEEIHPPSETNKHELTSVNTLGGKAIVYETIAQWYSRKIYGSTPTSSEELLSLICGLGVSGGRKLKERWEKKSKSQIRNDIVKISL
jgi:hypothetical protein